MIIKNTFYSTLSTLINFLAPILVLPIITNAINPESLGNIFYHEAIGRYISMFLLLGIPIYGVRKLAQVNSIPGNHQTSFIVSMIVLQLILVSLLVSIWISFFDINIYSSLTIMMAVFSGLSLEWALQGLEKFKKLALRNIIVKSIYFILTFLLVKSEKDAIIFFSLLVLSTLLMTIWNISSLASILKKFQWKDLELKEHLKPIMILFSSIIIISIYTMLDVLLLKEFSTDSQVTMYNIGLRIPKAAVLIISSFLIVIIPRINNYYNSDLKKFNKTLRLSFNTIIYLAIPTSLLMALNAEWILNILIPTKGYEESLLVMKILSVLPILIGLSNFMGIQVLTTYGFEKELLIGTLYAAILSITLNLLLIPKYGAIGAAISNLSAELCVVLTLTLKVYRRGFLDMLKIKLNRKNLWVLFYSFLLFLLINIISLKIEYVVLMNILILISILKMRNKYTEILSGLSQQ